MTYEEAFAKLSELVKKMEGGELTLDQSVSAYKDGMALLKICEDELAKYEKLISQIDEKEEK